MKRRYPKLYTCLCILLALALTAGVNLLAQAAQQKWHLEADCSYNALLTLSDTTKKLLDQLESPLTLYVLRVDGLSDAQVESVAEAYASRSEFLQLRYIDPDQEPALMNRVDTTGKTVSAGSVILEAAGGKLLFLPVDDFTLYGTQSYNGQDYTYKAGYQYELLLDRAILELTTEEETKVVFLTGHGEYTEDESSVFSELLQAQGYKVSFQKSALQLTDVNLAILLSPAKDLTAEEAAALKDYLADGGSLLVSREPGRMDVAPHLEELLAYYGLAYENSLVIANPEDESAYYPGNPAMLVAQLGDAKLLSSLQAQKDAVVLAAQCVPVLLTGMKRNDYRTYELLTSRSDAYCLDLSDPSRTSIVPQEKDTVGKAVMAAAVEQVQDFESDTLNGRIVALGSSHIVNNASINRSFYNSEFAAELLSWLCHREAEELDIVFKPALREGLKIYTQETLIHLGILLAAIPVVILLIEGAVRLWRKKR